eukprot:TRINITY_DN4132_c0_g1_i6.p1 TRINITY_DN4132_c0_g1~~TRINITY_DN4132_c0_g1_i6.p1  ORF type:complete len:468 (+),score=15.13 TRINITY_DN4132_c0_g1_i6:376-1779(+)
MTQAPSTRFIQEVDTCWNHWLDKTSRTYNHSDRAIDKLNSMRRGVLKQPHSLVINLKKSSILLTSLNPMNQQPLTDRRWTLVRRTKVSSNLLRFTFKNDSLRVRSNPKGFEWFGKHFQITATIYGKRVNRFYSFCPALTQWLDAEACVIHEHRFRVSSVHPEDEEAFVGGSERFSKVTIEDKTSTRLGDILQTNRSPLRKPTIKKKSLKFQLIEENAKHRSGGSLKSSLVNLEPKHQRTNLKGTKDSVDLFVKVYQKGLMSNYLADLNPGDEIEMEGPVGLGLQLCGDETGNIVFFAAGTGILAFLDFLHYFLTKFKDVHRSILSDAALKIGPGGQDDLFYNMDRIIFFISFRTADEAQSLGYGIITSIREIQKEIDWDLFDIKITITGAHERLENEMTGRFSHDFIIANLPPETNRIYICGPSEHNMDINKLLVTIGYPLNLIYICLLYTSPSPRDGLLSRMPSSA